MKYGAKASIWGRDIKYMCMFAKGSYISTRNIWQAKKMAEYITRTSIRNIVITRFLRRFKFMPGPSN